MIRPTQGSVPTVSQVGATPATQTPCPPVARLTQPSAPRAPASTPIRLDGAMAAGVSATRAVSAITDTPAEKLSRIVDAYWDDYLELDPLTATSIGDDSYNDRLANYASPEYAERSRAIEQRYLDDVLALNKDALDPASRITYDVFVNDRTAALAALHFPGYLLPFNQIDSLTNTFVLMGSASGVQPFATPKDYDDFAERCHDFVTWCDTAIASMREGLQRGITLPKVTIAQVVPQLRDIAAGGKPEESDFWGSIKALPDSFPESEKQRITALYRGIIGSEVLPAYARLADFIEREYVPAARDSVAWADLPDGKAWYAERVRNNITTDMTPDAIFQVGIEQVASIRAAMEAVKDEVGFKGDLHAFFDYVKTDKRFYYTSGPELVQGYRDLKKRIDELLPKLFAWQPPHDYEIREVEPFRAASESGAFYEPPSEDGSRPGIFYVNTFNLNAQPKFGMETLSLHEASPGHHFQISAQQESQELPRFRRFNGYVAFQEGWALYSESLGKEFGLYTDPFAWYGHLSDGMLRAMRLVVDTGLHTKGWTREQAIDYMLDNSSMARSDVEAEVDRYIVTPGQALGYKLGELRIRALRDRAEKELGAKFDVKAFHREMLSDGSLPLDVLDRKIEAWIARLAA